MQKGRWGWGLWIGGGGAEPELQIILEIASCSSVCNQAKTGLTGEVEVTVDFCQASPGDCLSLGLNGTACIRANVKMSQHFIVSLIIHSPPSPACHRLREREREREL